MTAKNSEIDELKSKDAFLCHNKKRMDPEDMHKVYSENSQE